MKKKWKRWFAASIIAGGLSFVAPCAVYAEEAGVDEKQSNESCMEEGEADGWHQSGEYWYYVINGEWVCNEVILIDGKYYGFDPLGFLYTDRSFYLIDDQGNYTDEYRAKADGSLYENEWYDEEDGKVYYGEKGVKAENTVLLIDDNYYGFDISGVLYVDKEFTINENRSYRAKEDGSLYQNEWYQYDDEAYDGTIVTYKSYYDSDCLQVKDTILEFDGKLYYFSQSGYNSSNGPWHGIFEYSKNGKRYVEKEDGTLLVNDWYQVEVKDMLTDAFLYYHKYYSTDDGSLATGVYSIDGTEYLFNDNGLLCIDGMVKIGDKIYISDEDGVVSEVSSKKGWLYANDKWYYITEDGPVVNKVIKIGSEFYGFDELGCMYENTVFHLLDTETNKTKNYRAKENGVLYCGGWTLKSGAWYYYNADASFPNTLQNINNKLYLFNSDGMLQKNRARNIYDDQYGDGIYASDSNGVATKLTEGWNLVGNRFFYVKNGTYYRDGIYKIGNAYYGFDSYGCMQDGTTFGAYYTDSDNNRKWGYFRAKDGGKLFSAEWIKINDIWYYYMPGGAAAEGIQTVNGKQYGFDRGILRVSQVFSVDGVGYCTDHNGVAKRASEGWNQIGDKWYLLKNGEWITYQIVKIGSEYYGFDGTGAMYENENLSFFNSERNEYCEYYAQNGGKLVRSRWYGNSYYRDDASRIEQGAETIGGKKYYFSNGIAMSNAFITVDGILYYAGKNCVLSVMENDGFYYLDNGHYGFSYVCDGKLTCNEWKLIDGKYYYFDQNGFGCCGYVKIDGKWYLFQSDGSMVTKGWAAGNSVYVTSSGALALGELQIGGSWYYFTEKDNWTGSGIPITKMTGFVKAGNEYKLYATDGKRVDVVSGTGWKEYNGSYYYINNDGSLASGYCVIDNNGYFFDENHFMVTDSVEYMKLDNDYVHLLFTNTGKQLKNGWYAINTDWYYVENGILVNYKEVTINGKLYAFDSQGRMITNDYSRWDYRMKINKQGIVTAVVDFQDGWYYYNNEYYYYKNGNGFTGWVGNYRIETGYMLRNQKTSDGYWVNYDGKYQKNAGWAKKGYGAAQELTGYYVKAGGCI